MKIKITLPRSDLYGEAFKRQVVGEYERGGVTKNDLMRKYEIGGHCSVLRWCRKYGKLNYTPKGIQGRPMKDPQRRKIKELEQELKETKEKLEVYEKLIEITNRELGEDVLKKIATKLSKNWQAKVG
jgi:transposase-like protein